MKQSYKNIIGYTLYIPVFVLTYIVVSGLFYWMFINLVFENEDVKTELGHTIWLYYWQIASGLVGGSLGFFLAFNILRAKKKLLSTILFVLVSLACIYLIYFNASVKQYDGVAGYASLLIGSFFGWGWTNNIEFKKFKN